LLKWLLALASQMLPIINDTLKGILIPEIVRARGGVFRDVYYG